jgi:hypothetical protein
VEVERDGVERQLGRSAFTTSRTLFGVPTPIVSPKEIW